MYTQLNNEINKSARGKLIAVSVFVADRRQSVYRRRNDGQPFVAGTWGASYMLEVRNLSSNRIEVLSSVDGRNTLRDEVADSYQNRGMIIAGYGMWTITGWRLDDERTAEFVFTEPGTSVTQMATGSAANAGVFGFAVYTERRVYEQPVYRSANYSTDELLMPQGLSLSADMGTGIGDVRHDSVGHTTFMRAQASPSEIITIQYRSREWLEQAGIIAPDEPSAFPGNTTGYQQYIK
jgi:hypothetical protein